PSSPPQANRLLADLHGFKSLAWTLRFPLPTRLGPNSLNSSYLRLSDNRGLPMAGPIDAVVAIHNAFRKDMSGIDAAALDSARGKPGLEATVERFRFMNEVLEWHAHGEELAIFPALEAV